MLIFAGTSLNRWIKSSVIEWTQKRIVRRILSINPMWLCCLVYETPAPECVWRFDNVRSDSFRPFMIYPPRLPSRPLTNPKPNPNNSHGSSSILNYRAEIIRIELSLSYVRLVVCALSPSNVPHLYFVYFGII